MTCACGPAPGLGGIFDGWTAPLHAQAQELGAEAGQAAAHAAVAQVEARIAMYARTAVVVVAAAGVAWWLTRRR